MQRPESMAKLTVTHNPTIFKYRDLCGQMLTILAVGACVKSHNIMSWVNILTAWLESLSYRRCSAGPVIGWSSTWMPTSDCRQQRLSKNYDVSMDQDQNFRNIWEVCWNIWSSLYLTIHYCSDVCGQYTFFVLIYAHQSCVYLIKNTIVKYYSEFSASLLQASVSHDPSEINLICWFAAQKTFLIIISLENSCAA